MRAEIESVYMEQTFEHERGDAGCSRFGRSTAYLRELALEDWEKTPTAFRAVSLFHGSVQLFIVAFFAGVMNKVVIVVIG